MSVGSVDRSESQNIKESYEDREKSLEARHKRQVADQETKHQDAVRSLEDQYTKELDRQQKSTKEVISDKERKHMQEVQNLQEASRKKMISMKSDDDDKFSNTRKTADGELSRTKEQSTRDKVRLTKTFEEELGSKDKDLAETEERYRTSGQEAIKDQGKRFSDAHEKEKSELNKAYTNNIEEKDGELTRLRKEKDKEGTQAKYQSEAQKKALEAKYMAMVDNERRSYHQSLENMEDGFQIALKENKDRYKDHADNISKQFDDNFNKLKQTVDDRVMNDIQKQRNENDDLKSQNNFDKAKMGHDYQLQKAHMMGEYKNNFDELEMRRRAAVEDGNRMKKQEIESITSKHERSLQKMNDEQVAKYGELKNKIERDYVGQVDEARQERNLNQIQSENVRKKLAQSYADSLVNQSEFHEDQIEGQKRDNKKMLNEQRFTLEKQKTGEVKHLREQLVGQSQDHQERVSDLTEKFESQMNQMKSEYEKKMRRQSELFHDQTEKQVKYLQMDREAGDAKLNQRIGQIKEAYEKEIDQLRKRQAQERTELASTKKS